MTKIYNITNLQDLDRIYKNSHDNYFLLKFHADWCSPCKKIENRIKDLSNQYQDIIFISINIENDNTNHTMAINEYFNITSLPTFILMKSNGTHLPSSKQTNTIIIHKTEGIDLSSLIGTLHNIQNYTTQKRANTTFDVMSSLDRFEPPNINFTRELGYNKDIQHNQLDNFYQSEHPYKVENTIQSYNNVDNFSPL